MMPAGDSIMSAAGGLTGEKSNFRSAERSMNAPSVASISKRKIFGWQGRKGLCRTLWLGAQDEKLYRYREA